LCSCLICNTKVLFTLQAPDVSVQTVFRHAHERSVMVHTHFHTRTLLVVLSLTLAAIGLTQYAGQRAALLGESLYIAYMQCVVGCNELWYSATVFLQSCIRSVLNGLAGLFFVHWWGWRGWMGRLRTFSDSRSACDSWGEFQQRCVAWLCFTSAACSQVLT
jgi:hypothetical protein